MKIRAGFVSNSSSTSFLIIAKRDFTAASLRRLMGIEDTSPLAGMFEELYQSLLEGVQYEGDMSRFSPSTNLQNAIPLGRMRLSEHMLGRLEAERGHPVKVFIGSLSSDSSPVESFFCTDSFEEENDEIYINGLDCAW